MRYLHLVGLAVVIGLVAQAPAFARGGHGGHSHGGHRSHGHGGHGHHAHAHGAHSHHAAAHGAHHGARRGWAFAHHRGIHNRHYAGHHAAWAHHYAHHWHNWGGHAGWGYHHGWGYNHGWGWGGGGWNWYGGGVNVVGPTYVDPGYVAPATGPGVVVVPPATAQIPAFISIVGTIRTINGPAISVATEDGDPITVDTTPTTTIVLNSRQATL